MKPSVQTSFKPLRLVEDTVHSWNNRLSHMNQMNYIVMLKQHQYLERTPLPRCWYEAGMSPKSSNDKLTGMNRTHTHTHTHFITHSLHFCTSTNVFLAYICLRVYRPAIVICGWGTRLSVAVLMVNVKPVGLNEQLARGHDATNNFWLQSKHWKLLGIHGNTFMMDSE